MNLDQVTDLYQRLGRLEINAWLQGGWGIDALLGRQTRKHKDLDLLIKVTDVARLLEQLEPQGFTLAYTWEENLWRTEQGTRIPTAFVLGHADGRELDLHAARFNMQGFAVPAWASERIFSAEDLAGRGSLNGISVRCWSAEMQMRTHLGYELPSYQVDDLRLLHDVLGVDYPAGLVFPGSDPQR